MKRENNFILLKQFLRGLPIVIISIVIAFVLVNKYITYSTPIYESTAEIKLADTHVGIPNTNLYKDFDVFANNNQIAAEVELIKSKVLIEEAVGNLGVNIEIYRVGSLHNTELYAQSPVQIITQSISDKYCDKPYALEITKDSLIELTLPSGQTIKGKLNEVITSNCGSFLIMRNESLLKQRPDLKLNDNYQFIIHSQESLITSIQSRLDVMAIDKDVPVLRINYKSAVPQKAADIVNAIANAYITDYVQQRTKAADTTANFLDTQLVTYSNKLASSEDAIQSYRDAKNIVNIKQETETDLRKIADLKKQKAALEMNLKAVDSLNDYIVKGSSDFLDLAPNYQAFNDLLSTEIVKNIKLLQQEKRDLLLKYTPENDKVKVVDEKIADQTSYLQEAVANTRKDLQIKYNDLNNTIDDAEKSFIGLPDKEKNMTILERNFGMNEDIYRFLHEKRTDAAIAKAANISFHRIISDGEVPVKPVSPNSSLLRALAVFLGFVTGTLLVYLFHVSRARVTDESIVYKNSDTPLFAAVPYFSKKDNPGSFYKKTALKMLLANWLNKGCIITFSSFSFKEGKSFNAYHLAKAIQQTGKKALVVSVENNKIDFNKTIDAISTAELNNNWQQPEQWKHLINAWKENYDVVIIRNAPFDYEPSSLMVAACSTINLLLLDTNNTKKNCILQADLLKQELNISNMHFVLNRVGYSSTGLNNISKFMVSIYQKYFLKKKSKPEYKYMA